MKKELICIGAGAIVGAVGMTAYLTTDHGQKNVLLPAVAAKENLKKKFRKAEEEAEEAAEEIEEVINEHVEKD